jgi:hypothetical protein
MRENINLDDLDSDARERLLDFRAAEAGPIVPPIASLDEIRTGLKVARGAFVKVPSGDLRDAADLVSLDGQLTGMNDWVATELGAVIKPNPVQQNALACARLWAGDAPWPGLERLFAESQKTNDNAVKLAANHNQTVLYEARVAADSRVA